MVYDKVSILIPAYNAAQFLAQTIESALGQDWPNLEVIVVDDGSKDNTLAIAQAYASEKVRVATQPNSGASAARNHAFALATGTYIQYLDADDLLHPQKISAQMAGLRGQPASVLSASAWGLFYEAPDDTLLRPSLLWQDYAEPTAWVLDAWGNGLWMPISAWLTHRELIAAAGPWNEQLSLHDDGEFFCRVVLGSSAILFCEQARFYYRKGLADSLSSGRSARAVRSHLEVTRLYEQHLLARRADAAARQVCANMYQAFIYEYYPAFPELRAAAAARVQALGGSSAAPSSTPLFRKLDALVGWRLSKRIQHVVYQFGLNPAAWKAKLSR
jgi:glycosyltransferase involved in cell wall biosynthesis